MPTGSKIPLVSVIMPTFNNKSLIRDSIHSVLSQTLQDWELIIVDDASTDGTADYIRNSFDDDRIVLVSMSENSGSGACRNRAIELAQGEFIAVLDADDICMPSRLDAQSKTLLSDSSISVVASQVVEFGDWGGPAVGKWPTQESLIVERQRQMKMPVPHPSVMFRRTVLDRVGGYDTACRRAQDFALFLRLSNDRIICMEQPLVAYRTSRPISLKYVIQNDMYASLAVRRHLLREVGTGEAALPVDPKVSVALYVRSLRNWSVRNIREFFSRPFKSFFPLSS